MKVYAVCPGGVGTSLVLKQNLINVFEELNLDAEVGFMGGFEVENTEFDLCFIIGYVYEIIVKKIPPDDPRRERMIRVQGVMDMDELREKAVEVLKKFGYIS